MGGKVSRLNLKIRCHFSVMLVVMSYSCIISTLSNSKRVKMDKPTLGSAKIVRLSS